MTGILLAPCRTMVAENIREFQRRTRHACRASGRRLGSPNGFDEMIKRAYDLTNHIGGKRVYGAVVSSLA